MFFPSSNSGTLIGTILRCNILDIHQVYCQREFQDFRMEVLYHIRPYFVGIFPYLHRPYIGLIYCRHLEIRFLKWPIYTVYPTGSIKLEKYPYISPKHNGCPAGKKNNMYIYMYPKDIQYYITISYYLQVTENLSKSQITQRNRISNEILLEHTYIYIYI